MSNIANPLTKVLSRELVSESACQHIYWTMGFKEGKLTRPYSSKGTKMSSMGELTFFLGLQVKQKKDGIFISQDNYVAKILKKDGKEVDVHMYRLMIGSLMYLTSSRPDIMFAVCACARYQVNPKVSHLHAVKRIFKLISWQCKKQTVVANSTTKAEYVAALSCYGQVLWIQNQLLDYGYNFMHTKIFIDNNRKAKKSVRLMMGKLFGMELKLILVTQS
ncbi:hypothetical protein Tco_0340513 [Tanacetum coccineum]